MKRSRDPLLAGELDLAVPLRSMSNSASGRGLEDPQGTGSRDIDYIDVLCERLLAFAKDHETPRGAGGVVARETRLDEGDAAVVPRSPAVDDGLQDVGGNKGFGVGNDPGGLPSRQRVVLALGSRLVTVARWR